MRGFGLQAEDRVVAPTVLQFPQAGDILLA
jgi:hypothetical protein